MVHAFSKLRCLLALSIAAVSFLAASVGAAEQAPARASAKFPATKSLAISGLVLDADFVAVPGANIQLFALENNYQAAKRQLVKEAPSEPLTEAESNANGRFRLRAQEPGVFVVRVSAPGHLAAIFRPLPAANHVELPPVVLQPVTETVLEFRYRDGRPVTDAFLAVSSSPRSSVQPLTGDSKDNGWRPGSRSGYTDHDGRLAFDKVAGERLDVTVLPPWSHRPQRLRNIEGGRHVLEPQEPPRRTIRVLDAAGEPIPDALALLGPEALPIGTSTAAGTLEVIGQFDEPEPLQLLTADGRRLATWHVTAPEGYVVTRQLPARETLTGRALSIAGRRPLAGALVWSSLDPGRFTTTADDGSWTFHAAVEHAQLWLEGRARDHLPRLFTAQTRHHWQGRPLELVLEKAVALRGRVVDAAGAPVPDVELWLDSSTPWPAFRLDQAKGRAITDAQGRFRMVPLWQEGRYRLGAFKLGYVEARLELERTNLTQPLTVVLAGEKVAFGAVVDLEGTPIAGAMVRALAADGRRPRTAHHSDENPYQGISREDGRFELASLPASVITLEASSPGFAPMKVRGIATHALDHEGPLDLGTLVLEKGMQLAGRVIDEDGEPIAEAAIWQVAAIEPSFRQQVTDLRGYETAAQSNTKGLFTIQDLVPDSEVSIAVFRPGYLPQFAESVQLPRTAPLEITLAAAATIAGQVADGDGKPIPGASVSLDPKVFEDGALEPTDLEGDDFQSALTDADGRFLFETVTPGEYRAKAASRTHQPAEAVILTVKAEDRINDVDFVLEDGAVLTGLALTEDDEPLAGVRVVVGQAYDISNSAGHFRVQGIPPGRQIVEGRYTGLPAVREEIPIEPGENNHELIFPFGFEVEGRVTDSSGRGVGGVFVTVDGGLPYDQHSTRSDSEGTFLLEGVGVGDYRLRATKDGFAPYERQDAVNLKNSSQRRVRVIMESGGIIAGQLIGLDFEDLEKVVVVAQKGRQEISGEVDFEGLYTLEDLGAGDWLVRARVPESGLEAHARVPLVAGGEATQDLDFERGLRISGTVLWNGEPLARTYVALHGLDAAIRRQTASDHEGQFELANMPPGRYRVDASNSRQFLNQNIDIDLQADRELLIEFDTAKVEGRVLFEEDESPLPYALVSLRRKLEDVRDPGGSMATIGTTVDGSFRFGRLVRGTYDLSVKLDGFQPLQQTVEVDGDVGPLDLLLSSATGLDLIVRGANGVTPPYVNVSVAGDGRPTYSEGRQVGQGGAVRLKTLPEGQLKLWIAAPGSVPAQVDVLVPSTEPVEVSLEPAANLSVRVDALVRSDGLADLQLIGEDGRPWRAFDPATGLPQEVWSVVAGIAKVEGVPAGQWIVQVQDSAGTVWESAAATAGGQETLVNLD